MSNKIAIIKRSVSNDIDYQKYITAAHAYWDVAGYSNNSDCEAIIFSDGDNEATVFIRFEDCSIHISRFVVEKRGDGFGSRVVRLLQDVNEGFGEPITLWSGIDTQKFYERLGFVFKDGTVENNNNLYVFGGWNVKGVKND